LNAPVAIRAFYSGGTLRTMHKSIDRALLWFRRDLRVDDQAALYHALRAARQVWCVFVFDTGILDSLPRQDRRVEFIRDSLIDLDEQLRTLAATQGISGAGLLVRHGRATEQLATLARELGVQAVYANHDDDPYALARDAQVRGALADAGIVLHTSKGATGTPPTRTSSYRRSSEGTRVPDWPSGYRAE
jgi:deoxyribodipyrimidine photo-lyase